MSNNHESLYHIQMDAEELTVRQSTADDARELRRLAELDSAHLPLGPSLIAELDGVAVAAYSLEEQRAIADPFRPTAPIVELLASRARILLKGTAAAGATQSSRWRTTGLRAAPASSRRRTGVV